MSKLGGRTMRETVTGPLGEPVTASFALLPGGTAVVEMAAASGMSLIPTDQLDPLGATTKGTGELIARALESRPRSIIVGAGGSASSDGGAGIATELGVTFHESAGEPIASGANGLLELNRIDVGKLHVPRATQLMVACDVSNPLLGEEGAARVFGPQKGAGPAEVEVIEQGLSRFADVVERDIGVSLASMPKAGAAGGAAGGMHALLGAELRDGFELVAGLTDFESAIDGADLLITGEGKLDSQSLGGKAPIEAARRAAAKGIRIWAFAGKVELDRKDSAAHGIEMVADLTELLGDESLADPRGSLQKVAARMLRRAFSD